MAFQPYHINSSGPFPSHRAIPFDTVCITGFSRTIRLDEIRDFFHKREGPCSCGYILGYPNYVAVRFSSPLIAQRVLRYSNAFIAGHKVQVFPYHHLSDAMAQAGQLPIAWNHFYQGNVPAQQHGTQLYGSLMNTNMHNKTMPAETFLANVLSPALWQRQTNYTNVGYRTNGTQELPSFIARGYNSLEKCSGQAALQNLGTSFSQVSKDPGSHFKRKRRLDSPYKDQSDKNESMKKKRRQNTGLAVGGLDGTPDKSKQEDEGVKPGYSVIDSQQHVDLGENDLSGPKTQPQFRHERSKNSCNSFNTNDYSLQTDNFKNLSIKEDVSLPHALSDHPSLRSSHSLVSPRKMPHLLELSKERGINCKDSLAEGKSEDFPQGEFQDNNPLTQNSKGDFENISRHGSEFSELNDGNKCVTFVPECVGKVITNFSVKKLQDILEQARKQDSIISEKNYEGSNGISEKSLKVACSLAKDSCHGNKIEKKCKKKAPVEVSEKRRSKTAVCGLAKASCHGNNVGKKSKKKAPVGVSKKKRSKTNKVPDGPKKKSGKKSRGEIRKSSSNVLPATSIETFSQEQKLRKKKFMKLLELRKGEIEKEYQRECSTLLGVVEKLASKDPSLTENLKGVVREHLMELGDHLVKKLETAMEGASVV